MIVSSATNPDTGPEQGRTPLGYAICAQRSVEQVIAFLACELALTVEIVGNCAGAIAVGDHQGIDGEQQDVVEYLQLREIGYEACKHPNDALLIVFQAQDARQYVQLAVLFRPRL